MGYRSFAAGMTCLAVTLAAANAVVAQPAPPPAPPGVALGAPASPPGADPAAPPPPPGGRGPRVAGPPPPAPPPPPRGPGILIEYGAGGAIRLDVRCGETETAKGCADITLAILDRIKGTAK